MAVEPSNVGAAIAEIKARTGWTWREVATQLGTTPEYARKLATKPTTGGAGRALAGNVRDFQRTGTAQAPVQRTQRVRAPGGAPSVPAATRRATDPRAAFSVTRSVFRGEARDGWAVKVNVPQRRTKAGDREDARHAISGAVRSAARGRRRVMFRVTLAERDENGKIMGQYTVDVGGRGGYDASRALAAIRREGLDPIAWLIDQGVDRGYGHTEYAGDVPEYDVLGVEVIGMP